MPPRGRYFALIATALLSGFSDAQSNLRISSGGVDYTNGTLYAPFGSSLVVTCEGGVGEKRWYINVGFGGGKVYLGTDSSQPVYQSTGQLFVGDFRDREAENVFCEDEVLSTVFTTLNEGVIISSASVSPTSITVFWEPSSPESSSDRQASCCMVEQPGMCSHNSEVKISNGNFSLDGLEEFTNYSCRIVSFSAAFEATTRSDKPSSPPEGVQLVPVDSTSLRLEWGLPPELERNGIITQYVVECTGIASVHSPMVLPSPTFNTPPSLQQLLTGLSAFTTYSCRVAAANVNGTGPFSALASASTLEGLAGAVSTVSTSQVSDDVVRVNWSAPEAVNGILQQYVLVYREYDRPSSDVEVSVSLPATSFDIPGLSAGVPYSVVVLAETGAGRGAESERVIFFSKELGPTKAVSGVSVSRLGSTQMQVGWTELTLREAQGFPVYTVLYRPTGRVGQQSVSMVVAVQPPATIGGLNPATTFIVRVRVDTSETVLSGGGPVSESVTAPLAQTPPPSDSPDVGTAVGVVVALLVVAMVTAVAAVALVLLWRRSKKSGPSKSDAAKDYAEENPHLEVRLQPNPAYCSFHEAALQLHSPGNHGSPNYENVPMRVA